VFIELWVGLIKLVVFLLTEGLFAAFNLKVWIRRWTNISLGKVKSFYDIDSYKAFGLGHEHSLEFCFIHGLYKVISNW
jgi:hypothetical protein